MKSIREIYKIGRGPSSSHTMGPYKAAKLFSLMCPEAVSFRVTLYGSLAATGKGHLTDKDCEGPRIWDYISEVWEQMQQTIQEGLVQIPCIERNPIAALRALDVSLYSLLSDGKHIVSFDKVVNTMKRTGHDLPSPYKETALGGLAMD